MTRSTRANLDPRGALRERLRANRRGALLDEPSDDLRDNIAYRGGALERVVFALPFAMSMALISFVTVWGARLSPALTVLFICGYISYGWVKGIHSGFSALLVGIPLSRLTIAHQQN